MLDVAAPDFAHALGALKPNLVIHTAGPFQAADYSVAHAALAARAHYVDLADARSFVLGIASLDGDARAAERLVVSGASSVPGLSSAVVDALAARMARIDAIDIGISPGNRAPRGQATVEAILSYVGRPLRVMRHGEWQATRGWRRLRRERYPAPVGTRWLADCDVPDLELLPTRWPTARHVSFAAGLELRRMHFGLALLAVSVQLGLVTRLERHARRLIRLSERWLDAGSEHGAMHVRVRGVPHDGSKAQSTWYLVARNGDGPQIPATPAVVIARKLARGEIDAIGARPCLDLFTVDECLDALREYAVEATVVG